jgi:hypothetical protein
MDTKELKQDSRLEQVDGYLLKCLEREKDLPVVLSLAKDKLYAFPFDKVPVHWVVLHTVCSILLVLSGDEPIETLDVAVLVAGSSISPIQRHFIDILYSRHPPQIPDEDFRFADDDHYDGVLFCGGQPPHPRGSASQRDDEKRRVFDNHVETDGKRRKLSDDALSYVQFEGPSRSYGDKGVAKRSGETQGHNSTNRFHSEDNEPSDGLPSTERAKDFTCPEISRTVGKDEKSSSESYLPRSGTTLFASFSEKRKKPSIAITECSDSGIDLLVSFQRNLDTTVEPMVFRGLVSDWPACNLWNSSRYLLRKTRGGQSLVPVEVGSSYTAEGWSQRVMSFKRYLYDYVLTSSPETGYLAQYNLFNQYPELKEDFTIPDICCLADNDDNPPITNVWLGPKNTISPLHTDPHHNVFCQVLGYKRIRLYSPSTPNMYPRGMENGIDMSNTSQVNLESNQRNKFPDFPWNSNYLETNLNPGDSLFIPKGWWHHVQSLSSSISISFWF